jgi:hypothetical protein
MAGSIAARHTKIGQTFTHNRDLGLRRRSPPAIGISATAGRRLMRDQRAAVIAAHLRLVTKDFDFSFAALWAGHVLWERVGQRQPAGRINARGRWLPRCPLHDSGFLLIDLAVLDRPGWPPRSTSTMAYPLPHGYDRRHTGLRPIWAQTQRSRTDAFLIPWLHMTSVMVPTRRPVHNGSISQPA